VPRRTDFGQDIVGFGFETTVQPPAASTFEVEDPQGKAGNDNDAADSTSNHSPDVFVPRCLPVVEAEVSGSASGVCSIVCYETYV
jgi:hypothetical protein